MGRNSNYWLNVKNTQTLIKSKALSENGLGSQLKGGGFTFNLPILMLSKHEIFMQVLASYLSQTSLKVNSYFNYNSDCQFILA